DERIHLYRDGLQVGSARRKATFVIDDDVRIEAAVSKLGMKYVRARSRGTRAPQPLAPAQGTAEAWRARVDREHPAASRAVGLVATLVLVAVLALEVPQLINLIGLFAPHIGL